MAMSRRCIPYTPRRLELHESTFAIVTTAGVHLRTQEPFPLDGDNSWREIPGDVDSAQLMVTHEHYDHRHADQDINCVFPIDRLRELAADGVIKGVSERHLGFMGYTQLLKDFYERVAPAMGQMINHSKADAAILTAGCPQCHRVIVGLQREIEMCGIPTVLITLVPEASRQMGPSRAIHPVDFTLGDCTGGPFQKDLQRKVVLDALRRWEERIEAGIIWDIKYPEYVKDPAIEGTGEIVRE